MQLDGGDSLIVGELALDRRLQDRGWPADGLAKMRKLRGVILPAETGREAAVVEGIRVYAVETLGHADSFLNESRRWNRANSTANFTSRRKG